MENLSKSSASLALSSPKLRSHEKKNKEKGLVKNFQIKKKRKYSSLKFAVWNQSAIVHHVFIFLFANHKKISLLGSQREK